MINDIYEVAFLFYFISLYFLFNIIVYNCIVEH